MQGNCLEFVIKTNSFLNQYKSFNYVGIEVHALGDQHKYSMKKLNIKIVITLTKLTLHVYMSHQFRSISVVLVLFLSLFFL